jgi:hypothetical protein
MFLCCYYSNEENNESDIIHGWTIFIHVFLFCFIFIFFNITITLLCKITSLSFTYACVSKYLFLKKNNVNEFLSS